MKISLFNKDKSDYYDVNFHTFSAKVSVRKKNHTDQLDIDLHKFVDKMYEIIDGIYHEQKNKNG